jgi:hypothetical protein
MASTVARGAVASPAAPTSPGSETDADSTLADLSCTLREYIQYGDVASYMKDSNNEPLQPDDVRSILFQLRFILLESGTRDLTSYDFKCSNLGLKKVRLGGAKKVVLRYALDGVIALRTTSNMLVTPIDFGSPESLQDVREDGGRPASFVVDFTKLENSLPDAIILGDRAERGHSTDSWGLALTLFHLCNGTLPYEELMKDVKCPDMFKWDLEGIFARDGYSTIRKLVDEGKVPQDGDSEETRLNVLIDTFYRLLVLIGEPNDLHGDGKARRGHRSPMNPVYEAIQRSLLGDLRKGAKQYKADRKLYSFEVGKHPLIQKARATLEAFPDGMDAWRALTEYDPLVRWTVDDLLESKFMDIVKEVSGEPPQYTDEDKVVNCFIDGISSTEED